jgi:hypothetical protein
MSQVDLAINFPDEAAFNVELTGDLIVQQGIINPESGDVNIIPPIPGINAGTVREALADLNDLPDLVVLIENRLV